jgi:DNA-directed RNA polymerase specialized sigma24 family protein
MYRKVTLAKGVKERPPGVMQGTCGSVNAGFAEYRRALYPVAYHVLGNREEAEDAVQHGLSIASSRTAELNTRVGLGGWLARIVLDQAISVLHKRKSCDVALIASSRFERPAQDPDSTRA